MLEAIKKLAVKLGGWTPDALMVCGGVGVAFGAGLIYPPAGYIVGGLMLMGAGYLTAKGAG